MKTRIFILFLAAAGYAGVVHAGFHVVPEAPKLEPLPVPAAPVVSSTSWTKTRSSALAAPAPVIVATVANERSTPAAPVPAQALPVDVPSEHTTAATSGGNFHLMAVQFVGEPTGAIEVRRGFQREVSLMEAMRGIAPAGWTTYLQGDVPKAFEKRKVSWRGGRRWTDVMDIMANDANITVSVDWKSRKLYVALKPAPVVALPVRTVAAATAGSAVRPPALQVTQTWTAPRGSTLRDVVQQWAEKAHWTLDWVPKDVNYAIVGPLSYEGQFQDAITGIFRAYEGAERPLQVRGNTAQTTIQVTEKGAK